MNQSSQPKTEDDLNNKVISKLKEMGVKKDILKFLETGVDKGGHKWFDASKPQEQEHYIRNVLVNKNKENKSIDLKTYHVLTKQSLKDVLDYFEKKPNEGALRTVLNSTNFHEEDVKKIMGKIESYEGSDKETRILEFYFFVKNQNWDSKYNGAREADLKKEMYSNDKMKELSTRWNIQIELDRLFGKSPDYPPK